MKTILLLALLAPALALGQVYKCTDAKGKVVFQESACDADRGANRVRSSSSSGGFDATAPRESAAPKNAAPGRDSGSPPAAEQKPARPATDIKQTEGRRYIKAGMTRDEVIASIGQPDSVRAQAADRLPGGQRIVTKSYAVYEPRAGDDQTRTTVYYVGDNVNEVRRETVRAP